MTPVILLRHGTTDWNLQRRIQGRSRTRLNPAARRMLRKRRLPRRWRDWAGFSSPQRRARETAWAIRLLRPRSVRALREMSWGDWEGETIADLRLRLGDVMQHNEARGLDFRPPGGETPRQVRRRLRAWLTRRARRCEPLVAISHKGVLRAALSLATGWTMQGPPPLRLDWQHAHCFEISRQGRLYLRRANIPLRVCGSCPRPGNSE